MCFRSKFLEWVIFSQFYWRLFYHGSYCTTDFYSFRINTCGYLEVKKKRGWFYKQMCSVYIWKLFNPYTANVMIHQHKTTLSCGGHNGLSIEDMTRLKDQHMGFFCNISIPFSSCTMVYQICCTSRVFFNLGKGEEKSVKAI